MGDKILPKPKKPKIETPDAPPAPAASADEIVDPTALDEAAKLRQDLLRRKNRNKLRIGLGSTGSGTGGLQIG
jgi:hypothetical protein